MKSNSESKTTRIGAIAATILLVGAGVFLAKETHLNSELEDQLNQERLTSETRLSEKLELEKKVDGYKTSIDGLSRRNLELSSNLEETTALLGVKEKELIESDRKITRNNQELNRLRNKEASLKSQIEANDRLIAELKNKNTQLETALAQKHSIESTSSRTVQQERSLNDTRLETVKGNNRLTVKAKRTKRMILTARVPAAAKDISFKVFNEKGGEVPKGSGSFVVNVLNDAKSEELLASTLSYGTSPAEKAVELVYVPNQKLKAGIYRIEVFDGQQNLGNLQVRFN